MLTILAFILTLGLVITIHEYGHFQVARWCGVKVLKFSIGFGKPLFVRRFGADQTEFILAAIPLGGFVKMLDERELAYEPGATEAVYSDADLQRAFNRQSVLKRMAIVLAGPAANLLLAIVLYWLLFMLGVTGLKPIVGKVVEGSPAAVASIAAGEEIQKIGGKPVASWQEARWLLMSGALQKKQIEVQAISANQQIHLHQLDLSLVSFDEAEQDILDKLGLSVYQPDILPRIGEVIKGSPADKAGLKTQDLVLAVNQAQVKFWDEFVREIRSHPDLALKVLVERDQQQLALSIKPESVVENGKTVGRIGAAFSVEPDTLNQYMVTSQYSPAGALLQALGKTWDTASFSLKMLGNMLLGRVSWKGMSGPVTIANYAGQSAHLGIKVFISFLALISISIGVLNLLPIPVLDGGHFMYYMVEFLTGKPVSEQVMVIGQKIGFTLLGFMMLLALYNDMNRLISG